MEALFGTEEKEGLCAYPEAVVPVDGKEARLLVYSYTAILNDPEPMLVSISDGCKKGIFEVSGNVDAAVANGNCAEDEAQTFFEAGSSCRACVEKGGGDYEGCETSGECLPEVPLAVWTLDGEGQKKWYRGVAATVWACAPDYLAPLYIMAEYG